MSENVHVSVALFFLMKPLKIACGEADFVFH